jgi:hypothetical protein
MINSIEERIILLWLEVEMLTGTKFFFRENPPLPTYQYSMQANEAIEELQELMEGLLTENGCPSQHQVMQELGIDVYNSPTEYSWKVKMSHECIA